jgi:hypothetical protein
MLKRIPKSDISVRPFKAYKEWAFDEASTDVSVLYANDTTSANNTFNDGTGSVSYKSLFGQLRAQFYNGHEDNPFIRSGNKTNLYIPETKAKERFLSGSAKVISIPLKYVGEGIKKSSLQLFDGSTLGTYSDDGYGNLYDPRDQVFVSLVDNGISNISGGVLKFEDTIENSYTISLDMSSPFVDWFVDIQEQTLEFTYRDIEYSSASNTDIRIDKFDVMTGQMIVDNFPFLPADANGIKVGNVFYQQGLVTLNREVDTHLLSDWDLTYKSTQTIYEHEYLLISNQDEFNISQNPTAIAQVGGKYSTFIDSDGVSRRVWSEQPTKYIRKKSIMDDGQVLDYRYTSSVSESVFAGFEHYDLSGSIDTAGSFLAPFITTIGLYDDNCDLVAVAKLPQPIKSEPDIPINFIVRFDT